MPDDEMNTQLDALIGATDGDAGGTDRGGEATTTEAGGGGGAPAEGTATQSTDTGTSKGGTQDGGTQPASKQQQAPAQGQVAASGTDAAGNLIGADGQVVATAGRERRFYEQAQQARGHAAQLTQSVQTLQRERDTLAGQVAAFVEVNQAAVTAGLSTEERGVAYQVMAQWKKDPAGTIKYLLQEAKSAGINVEGVGGPGVDMAAIKQLVNESLQPFNDERQQSIAVQTAEREAVQEVTTFYARHPDAELHDASIAAMLSNPGEDGKPLATDLGTAYIKLKLWCHEKGFDWTQPLPPQVAARQAGGTNQQASSSPAARSGDHPPFQRGTGGASQQQFQPAGHANLDTAHMSNKSIVEQAVAEALAAQGR